MSTYCCIPYGRGVAHGHQIYRKCGEALKQGSPSETSGMLPSLRSTHHVGRCCISGWISRCRLKLVTLSASQFQHLWADPGKTASAYDQHALVEMNNTVRGRVFQEWTKEMLKRKYPNAAIEDPVPGRCVNGHRRSKSQAEYDFSLNQRRVEVKGSQLKWVSSGDRWEVCFRGVKVKDSVAAESDVFDELYLVLFSPKWLHLVKHDLRTGITRAGSETEYSGFKIALRGGQGLCWEDALEKILNRLCTVGNSSLVARTALSDWWLEDLCKQCTSCSSQFYYGVPMATMSPSLRGKRVEQIVFEVDQLLSPGVDFALPPDDLTVAGTRRGESRSSVDWIRNGKRIETKQAQLCFDIFHRFWACCFANIKLGLFDHLLLAIYSPKGIDIFNHKGSFGLSTTGVRTEASGMKLRISASQHELDPLKALGIIKTKLEAHNCPHIASIVWDKAR